jgi:hypothetical protein
MRRFIRSESGAVTIDWVVLTAATVGMSLAVMSVVSDGIEDLADRISTQISDIQLRDSFDEWRRSAPKTPPRRRCAQPSRGQTR